MSLAALRNYKKKKFSRNFNPYELAISDDDNNDES